MNNSIYFTALSKAMELVDHKDYSILSIFGAPQIVNKSAIEFFDTMASGLSKFVSSFPRIKASENTRK